MHSACVKQHLTSALEFTVDQFITVFHEATVVHKNIIYTFV